MNAQAQPAESRPVRPTGRGAGLLVVFLLVGAAVSLSLGVYGKQHTPTGKTITKLGFPTMIDMKVWLATGAVVLALVQVGTALRIYGRVGHGPAPHAVSVTHRVSGVLAVALTVPVAYHCLWSLGFGTYDHRVLVHSLLGCAFYGVFVTKMLVLQSHRMPGWALPVLGALVFTALVGIWLTSSLWAFRNGIVSY
jgi:hypothetical protein